MTDIVSGKDKPVVLLVDSNTESLRHLGAALQSDYRVRVANSVERSLAVIDTAPPVDLLLLGIGLNAMDREQLHAAAKNRRSMQVSAPWHLRSLRQSIAEQLGLPADATAVLDGRRALVADDDELIRALMTEILSVVGINVVTANDGVEALDQMRHEQFDWVLLDMQMPTLDGLAASRAIRADPKTEQAVLIAVTGNDSEIERQRCLAAGINAVLAKPVRAEVLYPLLKSWLSPTHSLGLPLANESTKAEAGNGDIDLTQLDTLTEGNPERLRRYVLQFGNAMRKGLAEMTAALESGDMPALSRQAHSLKSTARWFGAAALGRQFEAVEKFPQGDNPQELQKLLQHCREQSDRVHERLEQHLGASVPPAGMP